MDPTLESQLIGTYCVCYNISYNEIAILVRSMESIKTIDDLCLYIPVCRKCNRCREDVQKIIDFYRKQP